MLSEIRSEYNRRFTPDKYEAFKNYVNTVYNHPAKFRLCETPVFMDDDMRKMLVDACESINKVLLRPDFKQLTKDAIPHQDLIVPGEDAHTIFLQMDFGMCSTPDGKILPQLIELQGFPSLYFFQEMLSHAFRKHQYVPETYSCHFDGITSEAYIEMLRKVIIGEEDPRTVILLEIEPEKQTTSIDFYAAEKHLGLKVLCISELKKRGKSLYYTDSQGAEVPVKRIYNRVIFDELYQRDDLHRTFDFRDEIEAEWIGHPNWFYRISKYTMPLLSGCIGVPECHYLHKLDAYPDDLENYVLKPLYSFAGSGVNLHIDRATLDAVDHRSNYILQRKVHYEPLIETPTGPAKFEIRMLMLWEKGAQRMKIVNNLVRVSKGEMVGVRYNKDKDWVGASVAFFPKH